MNGMFDLFDEAPGTEICSTVCPHCGATNVFRGFTVIEAFVCRDCGGGVNVKWSVQ